MEVRKFPFDHPFTLASHMTVPFDLTFAILSQLFRHCFKVVFHIDSLK